MKKFYEFLCQCPLGLIHHFYELALNDDAYINLVSMPSRAYTSFLPYRSKVERWAGRVCQCPLGLIPHFYIQM